MQFKRPEGQTARLLPKFQEYDFEILHRPGRLHGNADALSRMPRPCLADSCHHCRREEREQTDDETPCVCVTTPVREEADVAMTVLPTAREQQLADENIACVIGWLEAGHRPAQADIASRSEETKVYWSQWNSLCLRDGLLLRRWESPKGNLLRWQMVLPKTAREDILRQIHDSPSGGHYDENKTLDKVRQRYYWAKCSNDVKLWCRLCHVCTAKKGAKKGRSPLQQYDEGCPLERVAMDFMGPFPETESGNRHLLVIMDYFTNQEAVTVANVLVNEYIPRHGVPMELHTDQGRNFESIVIKEMCKLLGIHKTRTTAFNSKSDGMVERYNQIIGRQLAMIIGKHQGTWDTKLPLLLLSYRSAVHEPTDFTPSMLMYGRELTLPVDLMHGRPDDNYTGQSQYVSDLQSRLDAVQNFARQTVQLQLSRTKKQYDLRAEKTRFEQDDLVWMSNPQRKKGVSPKLSNLWEGPYVVQSRRNDVLYRIQKDARSTPKLVHRDRLRPYRGVDVEQRWAAVRGKDVLMRPPVRARESERVRRDIHSDYESWLCLAVIHSYEGLP